jgi:heat shock protein HslJ
VTGYNNGKQAVVGILAGSELTLAFAADGKLAGAAGCNNYTASFTTSGERIEIGQAAATRKVCSQPEGIMEQEDRFLNALASAATWRLDGDRLELRTAAGALALSLSAADSAAVWTTEPRRAALPSQVFLCGDLRVLLTHHGERMQLSVGGEIFAMQQIEAASGARYVAVDDATTSFWSKGDAATLVIRGQAYPNCMQVTAKASPFRTVSRHPG